MILYTLNAYFGTLVPHCSSLASDSSYLFLVLKAKYLHMHS